jgi:hypothetical protein
MEFVHDRDVIDFLTRKHRLRLTKIRTGEACTELVFERPAKSLGPSLVPPSN